MTIKCPICLQEFDDDNMAECPACGFKFSGKTEKFKPINAQNDDNSNTVDTNEIQNKSNNVASLRVISGPQGEIILPLTKKSMTIGRSPDSDIFLNDRTVSRKHAVISTDKGECKIADINSYNGLWVNNKNTSVTRIKNGDIIQIGVFFLRYEE